METTNDANVYSKEMVVKRTLLPDERQVERRMGTAVKVEDGETYEKCIYIRG